MRLPFGKVISYAHSKDNEVIRAIKEFFGKSLPKTGDSDNLFQLFEEWFIFDYLPKTKRKFIIEYCLLNPDNLNKKIVEQMKDVALSNKYGFFEILNIKPGILVTLNDILKGRKYTVYDHLSTLSMPNEGALFGRIGKVGNKWYFTGSNPIYLSVKFKNLPSRIFRELGKNFNPKIVARVLTSNMKPL